MKVIVVLLLASAAGFFPVVSSSQDTESYYIGASKIHGNGALATKRINVGDKIGVGVDYSLNTLSVTTLGQWVNHDSNPSASLEYDSTKKHWNIIAKKAIEAHDEITVNYDETPWFIEGSQPHFKN